jgi:SecD/SecF fusion protein
MLIKGLVKFLTIIIILFCIWELLPTYLVRKYETKIGDRAKREVMALDAKASKSAIDTRKKYLLDSLSESKLSLGYTYSKAKSKELKLGLDLQGGMNLVLEVGTAELVQNMAANSKDPIIMKAIADANVAKANGSANFVTLFGEAFKKNNPSSALAPFFVKPGITDISNTSTDAQVLEYLNKESGNAIENTYNVINKRIDKFGVSSPTVALDKNKGIISVELAGSQDPAKVRQILQASAKLEFWETYSNYEIVENFNNADKALASALNGNVDTSKIAGLDSNKQAQADKERKEHPLFSAFQFNNPRNDADGKLANDPIFGYTQISDTAKINSYMNTEAVKGALPKEFKLLYGRPGDEETRIKNPKLLMMYAIKKVPGSDKPRLSGDQVSEARNDFDQIGRPCISMKMKPNGANIWENMTGANIGKPIAVALDDMVYSAPAPSEKIGGGNSQITGSFTVEETKDVANVLASGKIDAPATIVQEQVVGPTLGAENIQAGKLTFLISLS